MLVSFCNICLVLTEPQNIDFHSEYSRYVVHQSKGLCGTASEGKLRGQPKSEHSLHRALDAPYVTLAENEVFCSQHNPTTLLLKRGVFCDQAHSLIMVPIFPPPSQSQQHLFCSSAPLCGHHRRETATLCPLTTQPSKVGGAAILLLANTPKAKNQPNPACTKSTHGLDGQCQNIEFMSKDTLAIFCK